MTILQIRIDENLKNEAATLYEKLGLDISTAVRIFLKKSISVGGIPFDMKIDSIGLEAIKAMDELNRAAKENGTSEMSLEEINEEIKTYRREKSNRK